MIKIFQTKEIQLKDLSRERWPSPANATEVTHASEGFSFVVVIGPQGEERVCPSKTNSITALAVAADSDFDRCNNAGLLGY